MNRGFSLVETITASFLISLVTLAIFNLFPSSAMMAKRGEMTLVADSLAQKQLEQMRGSRFESLAVGPQAPIPPFKQGGTEYLVSAEILVEPTSNIEYLKVARATVTWAHGNKDYTVVHEAWLTSVEP